MPFINENFYNFAKINVVLKIGGDLMVNSIILFELQCSGLVMKLLTNNRTPKLGTFENEKYL